MKLTKHFITSALPTAMMVADQWVEPVNEVAVSIDSRTIAPGELFVALVGATSDGHSFVVHALERGACGAVVAQHWVSQLETLPPALRQGKLFILVDDTYAALVALATAWRQRFTCPVVGITGSVGKTTTKEMVRCVLQAAGWTAYVSFKNYNTVFGVCYNLLRAPSTVSVIVLELGINAVGEMQEIVAVARPTIGVITNVGVAHLEGLGSVRTVADEKRKLFAFFGVQDVGIVYGDQALLVDDAYTHRVMYFGRNHTNDIQARLIEQLPDGDGVTQFALHVMDGVARVRLHTVHDGFVNNALAAAAVSHTLGIPLPAIVAGLEAYRPVEGRFQMMRLKHDKGLLINDCYNANPESMRAALVAFAHMSARGPKIAVLGDMLELGPDEIQQHRLMGQTVHTLADRMNTVILVGTRMAHMQHELPASMHCVWAQTWQEAQCLLERELVNDSLVLVKASLGMNFKYLVKAFVESK